MAATGVICEFNPFHDGHAYLLSRMRESVGEAGCVVCLMSGRFVQRGEAAMADPYLRARMALAGGADLVLELPFPWSAGSAEHFALGGVRILASLGVDTLTFGSECGDRDLLARGAAALADPGFGEAYAALCRRGAGTAAAYTEALRLVAAGSGIPFPDGFPSSNDLLGIAYLRALDIVRAESGDAPEAVVIPRLGAGYREDTLTPGAYPSATAIRLLLREAACDPIALEAMLTGTMPDASLEVLMEGIRTGDVPLDGDRLLPFYHALYRLKSPADMEGFAEWGGGMAGHVCRHAGSTAASADFFGALRTKQYPDARLRRALLFGALGVTESHLRTAPTYTTLLAATPRGCAYLKAWRKTRGKDSPLAVVTKPADAPEGGQRRLGEAADALFTLCFPTPRTAGELMRRSPCVER
jgi:predicted nucleotidyltransferase